MLERQFADELAGDPKVLTAADYIEIYGLGDEIDPVASAIDHAEARMSIERPVDPIADQAIAPVELQPALRKPAGDEADNVIEFDFGPIDPELSASIEESRLAAGDITPANKKEIGELIAITDESGNTKMVSAADELENVNRDLAAADLFEACNL